MIASKRLLFYLFLAPLLSTLFLLLILQGKSQKLRLQEEAFQRIYESATVKAEKQMLNNYLRKELLGKERLSFDHPFLKEEEAAIEKLISHASYIGSPFLEERLHFLKEANRLSFQENALSSSLGVKESILNLTRPVEMSCQDLSLFLHALEAHPLSIPLDFTVERKAHLHGIESYLISCKLLIREFQ